VSVIPLQRDRGGLFFLHRPPGLHPPGVSALQGLNPLETVFHEEERSTCARGLVGSRAVGDDLAAHGQKKHLFLELVRGYPHVALYPRIARIVCATGAQVEYKDVVAPFETGHKLFWGYPPHVLWPKGKGWSEALRLRDEARRAILAGCGEPDLASLR